MTRRHYQLFALAILIGAPLLVSLLANAIPGLRDVAPAPTPVEAAARPDYEQPPVDPMAGLPPALREPAPGQSQQVAQPGGAMLSTNPALDTSGIDVAAADGTAGTSVEGITPVPASEQAPVAMAAGAPEGVRMAAPPLPPHMAIPPFREGPMVMR